MITFVFIIHLLKQNTMKKFFGVYLLLVISASFVAKAEFPTVQQDSKFKFEKHQAQSFEITAHNFSMPCITEEISVAEPNYANVRIVYTDVCAVVNSTLCLESRCNGPPAGINI